MELNIIHWELPFSLGLVLEYIFTYYKCINRLPKKLISFFCSKTCLNWNKILLVMELSMFTYKHTDY